MAGGMPILGIGHINCIFRAGNKLLVVHLMWYHVLSSKSLRISPQHLFNKLKGAKGVFTCLKKHTIISFNGICDLTIDYHSHSYLPITLAK